ncbi:MAG TPA: DUF1080 domain-containing protein [Polyangiaceae bacterium]|nr:DUF1080 domain-containing protein [Polyangiaceae bacterium]
MTSTSVVPSASATAGSSTGSGAAGTLTAVGGGGVAQGGAGGRATAGPGGASGGLAGASAGSGGSAPGTGTGGAGSAGAASAVDLFNGTDLTGFTVYRQNQEKAPGTLLSGEQALAVFKPENGAIHVYADAPDQSPQVHYTLVTTKSYSKYKLSWDYKWGTKKFAPYTDLAKYPRDAGVLWHLHGDVTQLWPPSMEFQNKDGSSGDIFALYARCTSPGSAGNKTVFAEGGASVLVDGSNGFVQHGRSANYEVTGDWTPCLLEVDDGMAVYTVNGHIVNRVLSVMDAKGQPVNSGPIAWQAEQAEVYYRNLRIEVLP